MVQNTRQYAKTKLVHHSSNVSGYHGFGETTLMCPGISYISNIDLMLLNIIFFIVFPLHQNRL